MPAGDHPFPDPSVKAAFAAFPDDQRDGLLKLRQLILDTATKAAPQIGAVQETLKWGQPSYLTPETKSGTTIRLGIPKSGGYAIYTHCQTSIMSEFETQFPDDFTFEGNRAIHFTTDQKIPTAKLEILINRALTYHQKPKATG